MFALADTTAEMFSFLLLLLLEITGHCVPPQPPSVVSILQTWPRFLVLRDEVEIVLMCILTHRYAHKVIRIALYQ